jgi:myo-inositol catabolism protein IolC
METPDLTVGDVVGIRFTKWGDHQHWELDARYLGADEHGWWVGAPAGMPMSRPGVATTTASATALLVPRHAAYVATFYGPGEPACDIYVDMATVPVWEGRTVRAVDLDLDVIRLRDGRVVIDDEDEFLEHQVSLSYPDWVVTLAQDSCDAVVAAVSADEEPWRSVGHRWAEVGAATTPAADGVTRGR